MHLRTDTQSSNAHFSQVPTISKPRTTFSVARKYVTTIQFDYLYPIYAKFIYPGDTISGQLEIMARLQTQIATLYDDLYIDVHGWYDPCRLLQTDWARYQFNAQPAGPSQDNSALTSPAIDLVALGSGGFASKSLYDYFRYPTLVDFTTSGHHINNYFARAYNHIWNENYRDENLQNPVHMDLGNGPDLASNYVLLKRGRRHDKYGSALPFQQKGTAVVLPLGSSAPVIVNSSATTPALIRRADNHNLAAAGALQNTAAGVLQHGSGVEDSILDPNGSLIAQLQSPSINMFRTSVALQHLLEADARSGTRDVESIQSRWGVTVPDFRLQRPEYLGGSTFSFDGHVVPQTSASTDDSPQANLTQFSQALQAFPVNHSFPEHGVFMILVSARSNLTYQYGLDHELSYKTRLDWYQPEFANLGEVGMPNKEVFAQGTSADNDTWGFNEYGYWLRYDDNAVTAEMRSNYPQSLDSRHMADDPVSLPTLGSAWIQSNTPISRNIAVDASVSDPIQLNTLFRGSIARTIPMFSIPGLTRL